MLVPGSGCSPGAIAVQCSTGGGGVTDCPWKKPRQLGVRCDNSNATSWFFTKAPIPKPMHPKRKPGYAAKPRCDLRAVHVGQNILSVPKREYVELNRADAEERRVSF